MADSVISNAHVVIASNDPSAPGGAVDDALGDVILKTGGVERARWRADGTGTGGLGGSTPALAASYLQIRERDRQAFDEIYLKEGAAAVALSFDDGPLTDYTIAYPYLRDRQIPASFGLVQSWVGLANRLTWAQISEMRDHGMEMACHTATHGADPANLAAFIAEAITAADTIALADGSFQLNVDAFIQCGLWVGTYNLNTASKVDLTDVGDQLRARYVLATAYVPDAGANGVIELPTSRRIGPIRSGDLMTMTLAQVQQKVAWARGRSALVCFGTHSFNVDLPGYNTTAQFQAIIDWLAAERDAGRLDFFTMTAGYNAKHSPLGKKNVMQDGSFGKDSTGNNILGWVKLAGAATVNLVNAPSGGNSLTINSSSDVVELQLPAPLYRTIRVRFKAKNDVAGVNGNARLLVRGMDSGFSTINHSLDLVSGVAGTPGPWPNLTDNWQTYECLFRTDPRDGGLMIWPYYTAAAGRVGAVRYADFEVYKV